MADTGAVRSANAPDGAAIEYEVMGEGAPFALLHGGLAGRFTYARQFGPLSTVRRLILPSFRAHDGTPWVVPEGYGLSTTDVDDVAAVLDAEGADRVDMLGHSSGGAIAFAFASRYPDRVNRLVLIEPSLMALLPPSHRAPLAAEISRIAALDEAGDPEGALRETMALLGGAGWAQLDAETRARHLARLAPMAPFIGPHWRGMLQYDVTPEMLKALRPPVLLIYGGASYEFEAAIAETWRTHRPDDAMQTVDGAGHNVHVERSDIVNAAVLEFLNPRPRSTTGSS